MERIKENLLLEFNENQLQNVRKAVGYEDVNRLKQDIEQLQDWIQKQNHFRIKDFDEEYLERWLIVNKGSIERTKQKFDSLCTCTNLMPEFLQNFDIKNEFDACHVAVYNFVLPKPTKDNYRILITHLTGKDEKDVQLIDYYRYLIVMGHYMMCHDYCFGYEWINDLRHLSMGIVKKLNPLVVHKALNLIVESMSQRMKRIHMISGSKFFDAAASLIIQGMSAKLRDRVIIHSSVEGLYKYFSKEDLPKELGGDRKPAKEIYENVFKEMASDDHIARVKLMERVATDESRRLSCKFNEEYSGMPGSFKRLCVD